MAGLLAARVLSASFSRVSLIERDTYPAQPEPRPGVPQGRHVHFLLARGKQILEELFPGFSQRLEEQGAILGDQSADFLTRYPDGWLPRVKSSMIVYACTRPLLEWQVRQDLLRLPNVQIVEGHEATGLHHKNGAVIGVKMRKRLGQATLDESAASDLFADLVVEAGGRNSRIVSWLEEMGYPSPPETVYHPYLGYASRLYRPTPDPERDWKGIVMAFDAPRKNLRGGVILSVEGDRWIVVLSGMGRDYPPTDPEAFLEYARGLIDPIIYETLKDAEPLSPIYGFRKDENRWRHFERLKKYPERLLILGDAACSFDPVYGQGMTVAAEGALTLAKCLSQQHAPDLSGLAHRFQRQLARVTLNPWQLSSGADYVALPPEEQKRTRLEKFINRYFERMTERIPASPLLALTFGQVSNLLKPPTVLFHPAIAWAVFTTRKPTQEQASPK